MPIRSAVSVLPRIQTFTMDQHLGLYRQGSRLNIPQFYTRRSDGGIGIRTYAWDIRNGYAASLPNGTGAIVQRAGTAKLNTVEKGSAEKFRVLFEARWASGTRDIIARTGTSWSRYDGVDSFDDLTGATGRSSDVIGQAVLFNNNVILVDGGTPLTMTSSYVVSSLGGSPPSQPTAVHIHQHKVWMNSDNNPLTAYFSATDDAANWTATNDAGNLDLSKVVRSGDKILGYSTIAQTLLVIHLRNSTVIYYAGTDPADFELQAVLPVKNFTNNANALIGGDLVVPSDEGLNLLSSAITHQDLQTDDITVTIKDFYTSFVAGLGTLTHAAAGFYKRLSHYYLSFPFENDPQILVYDPTFKNIVGRYSGLFAYSFLERENGKFYYGGKGFAYEMNTGTADAGTAIEFSWDWPYLSLGNFEVYKALRELEALVNVDATTTVNFNYWFGEEEIGENQITESLTLSGRASLWRSAIWRTSLWRSSGNNRVMSPNLRGRGKVLGVRISHSTLNSRVTIPWWTVRCFIEGRH